MDIEALYKLQSARVLVIGDVMLDRYWAGETTRISPEAPVSVVNVGNMNDHPGGAANVAANITALGGHADLIGLTGDDSNADKLIELLTAADIHCHFVKIPEQHTITKLRVISRSQQLIRLDFEKSFHQVDISALLKPFTACLSQVSAVILSDYGKGTLASPQDFIQIAKRAGLPVLVDPKSTDFSRYRGATLVTPNQHEFEAIVGPCADLNDIYTRGQKLLTEYQFDNLLVTRGEQGMVLMRAHQSPMTLATHAREVFDVTGAGDTVIATLAAALSVNIDISVGAQLSNVAAGIAVGKLGTANVTYPELLGAMHAMCDDDHGVVSEEQLSLLRSNAKLCGRNVVMTNGCFDILHPGHIQYLNEAKRLGDRLIVAVNDDASVARLKGNGRPINSLASRMAVLAGLRAVDWVVPFSEDTPQRLIGRLLPDVLVKGGDYKADEIAGAKEVQQNGGQVKILSFVEGCSTTQTLEKIKNIEIEMEIE